MKILIIDDDTMFLNEFSKEISNFFHRYDSDVEMSIFSSGFFDIDYKEIYTYAFVDIDLKKISGIDISKVIKEYNPTCNIVFISAKNNLIHTSLTTHPFFFIRKTHYQDDLIVFYDLVKKSIKNYSKILLSYKSRKVLIQTKEIVYIEVHQHVLHVFTLTGIYKDNRSLKEITLYLPDEFFCQIHRSFFINLNYVYSFVRGEVWLYSKDSFENTKLIISRSFQKEFEEKYQEFLLL